jgi:acyl-CoA-binding protein
MPDLKYQFDTAAKAVQSLPRKPDNETLLKLYALYKQATIGDVSGKRPGFTDPVGRAKYDAWEKLRGKSQEQAMQQYIDLANTLLAA